MSRAQIKMSETHMQTHCLTVDVEDYFQVAAFRHSVSLADWDRMPSRVEHNTAKVLELFDELGVKATFFVMGWVAEKHPAIVRRIAQAGHELGCHSYAHQLIYDLTPEVFRQDTLRALEAIQQASGERVRFYRAPSFSITRRSLWALNILLEAGFTHDSSIFPIRHDLYGFPGAPEFPFVLSMNGGTLIEYPPSTVRFLSGRLPFTGGGYLRTLPLAFQKKCFRTLEKRGQPAMMYMHPWEFDPEQPRIKAPLRSRLRHYTGLDKTASRIRSLSQDFRFVPMGEVLPASLPVFQLDAKGEFLPAANAAASTSCAPASAAPSKGIRSGVNACL